MSTAETIARRRTELGLTQAELGRRVGTDGRNIRRYESGEAQPNLATAQSIAKALDITLDELAGGAPGWGGLWWSTWDGLFPKPVKGAVDFTHRGRTVDVHPASVKDATFEGAGLQWRSSLLADGDDLLGWFDLSSDDRTARGTVQLRRRGDIVSGTWVRISLRNGTATGKLGLGRTPQDANAALHDLPEPDQKD